MKNSLTLISRLKHEKQKIGTGETTRESYLEEFGVKIYMPTTYVRKIKYYTPKPEY